MTVLTRYARPEAIALALAITFLLLQGLAALAMPWLAGRFAGVLLPEEAGSAPTPGMASLLTLWLGVLAAQALARYQGTFLLTRSGARILANLSLRLHDHLLALPLSYLRGRKRGDLLALLSNDVAVLAHFATGTLAGLVPALFVLVGALVMMARIEPWVAVLVALLAPAFFVVLKVLGRQLRPLSLAVSEGQAGALAVVEEQLGLLPLIKANVRQAAEGRRFAGRTNGVLELRTTQLRQQALLGPALQLASGGAILLVLALSASYFQRGALSVPELVSLLLYGLLFARPVSGLANLYGEVQQARGAARRLQSVFAVAPEPDDAQGEALPALRGDIRFEDVHYAYADGAPVLQGVNLSIKAGEIVAITGPNGAGKSTLLHLLLRFMDPTAGSISLDGHLIAGATLDSLRRQVGLVTQEVLLVDGSVAHNIRYGHPDASDEAVEAAAHAAQALDFIGALPQGWKTPVGEGGVRLSGGQRQRIALARALLVNPPILLLDEATAMFDPEGEAGFVAASGEVLTGRTVLIVTHRPASLALADRVLRLQDGQLIEEAAP